MTPTTEALDERARVVRDFYSAVAPLYGFAYNSTYGIAADAVESFYRSLPSGTTVLDAGCGPGIEAQIGASLGHDVIGLDISEAMLERFRVNLAGARTIAGSITDIPLPAAAVGAVFAGACLLHLSREQGTAALREFARVVARGGALFLLTTTGEGSEAASPRAVSAGLGLPPMTFYHWEASDLATALAAAGFGVSSWQERIVVPGRPAYAFIVAHKISACAEAATPRKMDANPCRTQRRAQP